jgi:surface antigen
MKRVLILVALLLAIPAANASNFDFLHDTTPISDFTKEDSELFWNAIITALDTKKDGEKLAWKNDKSGNSGLVNPISSYKENETECRTVRIVNRTAKNISESKYEFCKRDGKWVAINLLELK